MSVASSAASARDARQSEARLLRILSSPWLTAGLILASIAAQALGHLDCDVSWFITFAEKFVDGRIPYVDVTDPNPPLAFLSLVPAVVLARARHVAIEPVVAASVFLFAVASIIACGFVLSQSQGPQRSGLEWRLLLNGAMFLLVFAPQAVFGEREHLALLALLPMLAVICVEAEGARPTLAVRLLAGVGAGLAIGFKPLFALPLALPVMALAWRERSLRFALSAEILSAALLVAAQAAALFVFFPAYIDYALPVIADVYAPARESWINLTFFTLAPFNLALLAGLVAVAMTGRSAPSPAQGFVAPKGAQVAALASFGFLLTFFVQGKGWINHAYPGLALVLLAWLFLALGRHPRPAAAREGAAFKYLFLPVFIAAPFLFGLPRVVLDDEEHPGLREAVARVAPAHPRVIAMARQLDFGHPITRQLGGVWVGRPNALWVSSFASQLLNSEPDPAARQRLEAYRRGDLAGFAQDVRSGRPDVIIVEDKGTREWVEKQPETAGVLPQYRQSGAVDAIELWTRRPE